MTDADEMVSALLNRDPQAARVLLTHGMHCVGCAIAPFETLAEVCRVYGVPLEQLLEQLRRHRVHNRHESVHDQEG